jgi:hypothetical protein
MKKLELTIGQQINNFIYLGEEDTGARRQALFRCQCGHEKRIGVIKVTTGSTKTCGRKECKFFQRGRVPDPSKSIVDAETGLKVGVTAEYSTYHKIKNRCYNVKDKAYSNYGGRGIKMCPSWLESFDTFLADMGKRPEECDSIDRINNDKGYSKENCQWSSITEQSRNKRNNSYVTYQGKRLCMIDAMDKANYHNHSLYYVYDKNPTVKDFEQLMAISKQRDSKREADLNLLPLLGGRISLRQACEYYQVVYQSVYAQINKGKDPMDAIAYLMSPSKRRRKPS